MSVTRSVRVPCSPVVVSSSGDAGCSSGVRIWVWDWEGEAQEEVEARESPPAKDSPSLKLPRPAKACPAPDGPRRGPIHIRDSGGE